MTPMEMTAETYLTALKARGIDVVFANAGTDFASIVEALARRPGTDRFPRFVTVPHENLAMAMAYGFYRATGRMAAVMVHVSVGTANTICGLMNAARDNVPVLLAAGRTPLTEVGHPASRNRTIHWGQECFDQGQMVREFVKWDYELRGGQPVEEIVSRAIDIAMSEPRGPVYLTLPREILAEPSYRGGAGLKRAAGVLAPQPRSDLIAEAARLVADAAFPLIITSAGARVAGGFAALALLADAGKLPVVQYDARVLNLPTSHPMHLGFELTPGLIQRADVIIAVETQVPWLPASLPPRSDATLIHLAADPLSSRLPFAGFRHDLPIAGDASIGMEMLADVLAAHAARDPERFQDRADTIAAIRGNGAAQRREALDASARQQPMSVRHIAALVSKLKAPDAIVVNELGLPLPFLDLEAEGSLLNASLAGGLGLGLGAALGAKIGRPGREVIVATGDGSYMFGNPLPYHWLQRAEGLPTLTIICNNSMWYAVKRATAEVYPKGKAAQLNTMPLTDLGPSPEFELVARSCGGVAERVEDPGELEGAMARALEAVRSGTPALLNVVTAGR